MTKHVPRSATIQASWTEQRIIPDTEPDGSSDQVCKLATSPVPVDLLVESEGMLWSLTPSTVAGESPLPVLYESSSCLFLVGQKGHSYGSFLCSPVKYVCSPPPVLTLQLCPSLQDLHHCPYSPAAPPVSPLTAPFQSVVSLDPAAKPPSCSLSIISAVDLHPDHPAGGSCLAASAFVSALALPVCLPFTHFLTPLPPLLDFCWLKKIYIYIKKVWGSTFLMYNLEGERWGGGGTKMNFFMV